MATELEQILSRIQPQYVGATDQVKAVMYALGIDPDLPAGTVKIAVDRHLNTMKYNFVGPSVGMLDYLMTAVNADLAQDQKDECSCYTIAGDDPRCKLHGY